MSQKQFYNFRKFISIFVLNINLIKDNLQLFNNLKTTLSCQKHRMQKKRLKKPLQKP